MSDIVSLQKVFICERNLVVVTHVRSLDVQFLVLAGQGDLVHPYFLMHLLSGFLALLYSLVLRVKVIHLLLDKLVVDLFVSLALERLDRQLLLLLL